MKRKIALILTTFILVFSLAACGNTGETSSQSGTDSASGESTDTEDYTIEDIAELNGLTPDELNGLMGFHGGLVFLGHKYGDEIVTNEDEALDSLKHVKTLAKLDGVELQYNRTDVSPVTGNVVYTFYQTASGEVDGEVITTKFYNSLVKVITDSEGNLAGLSADVIPEDEMETIDDSEFITMEEAIEYVRDLIDDPHRRIYEEASEYAFWDDEGTVLRLYGQSKISPAWFIYTDAAPGNKLKKPYEVFVVSVSPRHLFDEEGNETVSPAIISNFHVETLNLYDEEGVYTSEIYFDGMKDAGDYTYEINLDWVKKYYPEYEGPDKASYTVPVMYSENEDLYYLGSASKKIAVSNYYDFIYFDTTNAYVTDNPEDKNSWHFQLDKAMDESTGKYFNDPNYVLSSFSVMCDVWEDYYERYGLDSVDGTGLPTMYLVYETENIEYPENESGIKKNATNHGQIRDWQVMGTGLTYPGCLQHEVMSHEYTHGINGQLAMTQYFNSPGAVMEAYADIIGTQMSMLNGYPECVGENAWHHGGVYYEVVRNMGAPEELNMPRFPGGNYYLWPVESVISDSYDYGGVHTNSSILNFLAYCMVNGTGEDNEATLTMDECLDVWFDTLYYTNYQSDYYDVACYLQLAAKSMGLSEAKCSYLRTLLYNFGLIPDEEYEFTVGYEEESEVYSINLEYDESVYDDLADAFKFGFSFFDKEENCYDAGGVPEDGNLVYAVETDRNLVEVIFTPGTRLDGANDFYTLEAQEPLPHEMDIFFSVYEASPGDSFKIAPGYELIYGGSNDGAEAELDTSDEETRLYVLSEGTYVARLKDMENSTDDYGKYTILMIYTNDE